MTDYKMLVLCNALDGRDAEFNAWYDGRHLDDVLNVPGFHRAQRLSTANAVPGRPPEFRYATIYDFVSDDVEKTMAYFFSVTNTDKMPIPPVIDTDVRMYVCEASGTTLVRDTPTPWPE